MAAAGLGDDLLLANEVLDRAQLQRLADVDALVTIAVDSDEAVERAATAGLRNVLIDVNVGLPRCGIAPGDAGRLADRARSAGLEVRGVMGYEGHLMMVEERTKRIHLVEKAMTLLLDAAVQVGGDIISAGGTGTYDTNIWASEIQAGTFLLGDSQYQRLDLPFRQAIFLECSILSQGDGYVVANAGLKALGMDHGNPLWPEGQVLFCSDEHITLVPSPAQAVELDQRIRLVPAHLDPTVARHETMWLVDGTEVVDEFPVDLRHW